MSEYDIGKDMLALQLRVEQIEKILSQMLEHNQDGNKPKSAV